MELTEDTVETPRFTRWVRSLMLVGVEGLSLGFAVGASGVSTRLLGYVATNKNLLGIRQAIIGSTLTCALLLPLVLLVSCALPRAAGKRLRSFEAHSQILSPLCAAGFIPLLFQPELWKDKTLGFLITTALFSVVVTLCTEASLRAATRLIGNRWVGDVAALTRAMRFRIAPKTSLTLSVAAVLSLALYGLIATLSATKAPIPANTAEWALVSKFSGYHDLSLWFSSIGTRALGHVSILGALYTVWSWLWPKADGLLFLRLLAITWPAVPLLFWARRSLGTLAALFLALVYLSLPLRALLAANDAFPVSFSVGLFFLSAYYFDARRIGRGLLTAVAAIALHEEAAIWFMTLGIYFGTRERGLTWGTWLALAAVAYFAYSAFVLLPAADVTTYSGNAAALTNAARSSNPQQASQLQTAMNLAYSVPRWLDNQNLDFWLVLLAPLGFVPLRNSRWIACLLPGMVWSFLSRAPSDWNTPGYTVFVTLAFVCCIISLARLRQSEGLCRGRYTAVFVGWLAALLPCILMFGTLWLPLRQ